MPNYFCAKKSSFNACQLNKGLNVQLYDEKEEPDGPHQGQKRGYPKLEMAEPEFVYYIEQLPTCLDPDKAGKLEQKKALTAANVDEMS